MARSFQKSMWDYMGHWPQFVATHRPLDHSDFRGLLMREEKVAPGHFNKWTSGDYSAATDNVSATLSNATLEWFLSRSRFDNLSWIGSLSYRNILRSVLGGHICKYPIDQDYLDRESQMINDMKYPKGGSRQPVYDDRLFDGLRAIVARSESLLVDATQRNGQLMGSPLSFPILCFINLIVYQMSLEEYLDHEVPLEDLPVLVNGDDILFRTNERHYEIWRGLVAQAGFELSVGKNYVSESFFCINSRGYLFKNGQITDLPFLNLGLLTGQSKGNNKRGGSQ